MEACQTRPSSAALRGQVSVKASDNNDKAVERSDPQKIATPHIESARSKESRVREGLRSAQSESRSASTPNSRPSTRENSAGESSLVDEEARSTRRAAMKAELVFEKLRMLGYERVLGKCIPPAYFALPPAIVEHAPNSQRATSHFHDLQMLVNWLLQEYLQLSDTSILPPNDETSPVAAAQMLLIAAEKAHISNMGTISAPSLAKGYGEDACRLLEEVASAAIAHHRVRFRPPVYSREPTPDATPDDSMDMSSCQDDEGTGESTASSPLLDADIDRWLTVREDPAQSTSGAPLDMIFSRVSPEAWAKELKEKIPVLHARLDRLLGRSSCDWHKRLTKIKNEVASQKACVPAMVHRLCLVSEVSESTVECFTRLVLQ